MMDRDNDNKYLIDLSIRYRFNLLFITPTQHRHLWYVEKVSRKRETLELRLYFQKYLS